MRVTGFDVTFGDDADNVHATFDGTCYDTTSTYTPSFDDYGSYDPDTGEWTTTPPTGAAAEPEVSHSHACAGDPSSDSSDSEGSPEASLFGGFGVFGSAANEPFAITVTEVDGRWYVSPMRTILDNVVDGLTALQPDDVQKWGDLFGSSSEELLVVGLEHRERAVVDRSGHHGSQLGLRRIDGLVDPDHLDDGAVPLRRPHPERLPAPGAPAVDPGRGAPHVRDADRCLRPVRRRRARRCVHGGPRRDPCAATVVADYRPCMPLIDAVIASYRSGSDPSDAEDSLWACIDDVSG